ncbi:MAG: type IX secretion system sortase PorU [candidate division Zixibacteria bacterium]|nr:type IX secretion system sortase PorU [candidate division Zixibacteria bacterium]NIR64272.1 type IX secretion system sortase PorU [candidate division Zixibacteria bacterium]NIS15897.1 type IX secretion system sortase PorU [candidate division Zixibacteria bacterium]NIS46172.1 type IX secretion system sortase PorU [candidate division Zixibacteria bacterium]NIT52348.1 type IX secretion system sortase PorU [candidate division Zixibacteria bacterium]
MIKGIANLSTIISSLAVILILSAGTVSASAGIYADIEILSQSGNELVFKYTPGDTVWSYDGVNRTKILHIKGCENLPAEQSAPLPVKTIVLGTPFDAQFDYQIVSAQWSGPFSVEYANPENKGFITDPVELKPQAKIRSQNTQSLNIYPLIIENDRGRLLLEMTVRVLFNTSERALNKSPGYSDEGAFENLLSGLLFNYEQARNWREISRSESIALQARENVFEKYQNWVKLDFGLTGIQRITPEDLSSAGIDVNSLDPRLFRVFWGGGKPLNVEIGGPYPQLSEIAIYVKGEADASFDPEDYIAFYLPSANYYYYDTATTELEYTHNHYTPYGTVFMSLGPGGESDPLRMDSVIVTPRSSGQGIYGFDEKKRYEQNNFLLDINGTIFDFYTWYWREGNSFEQFINVEDLTGSGEPSRLDIQVAGRSPTVEINGFQPYDSLVIDGPYVTRGTFWSDGFSSGLNSLMITINNNIRGDHVLDFLELEYRRQLRYRGGTFTFYGQTVPGVYHYNVNAITADSTYVICDATDIFNQKRLVGAVKEASSRMLTFEYNQSDSGFHRFALAEETSLGSPANVQPVTVDNLIDPGQSYDLIVITPEEFLPAFGAYRTLRETDGYSVYLASVEDVYAQFSGGMFDPVAIRDFLHHAFEHWPEPSPSFVVLGGDGIYDYMGYTGSDKENLIPPFVVEGDQTVSDENYILFDNGGWLDSDSSYPADSGPDMIVGRWPVRNAAEVTNFIAKLALYEQGTNLGSWQNRLTFVADDENKPGVPYKEPDHTHQAENLANLYSPDRFDKKKIYLIEYELDSKGEKPGAKRQLIESINNGTLLVNFVGHGNPRLWTDERIFRNEDIPSLHNEDQLTVVIAASCSIGEFDSPYDEGMAEIFFRYNDGGAIASVATTRLVYSGPNADFNYKLFEVLFSDQDFSLAEAVYVAKFLRQQTSMPSENDKKFIMFGDPVMKMATPEYRIVFNNEELDSLAALNLVTVEGEVQDLDSNLLTDFSGSVTVAVFDNQQEKTYRIVAGSTVYDLDYTMPGARIFRGQTDVAGGRFSLQFVVPKDISYGGEDARISAYAESAVQNVSASGSLDSIRVSGTVSEITDSIAPEIKTFMGDEPLADGVVVPQQSRLRIELFDSSGINLSGEVGHKFELNLDDDPFYTFDLTDKFIYYPGSYQNGEAELTLPEVEDGNYTLKIKAWDSANNSSLAEYNIAIGSAEAPEIAELYNVPNPFSDETQFYYELSSDASEVSIDIFTLNGRKIHTLRNLPGREGENLSSLWDGRDNLGDKLANGVYIYKLSIRTAESMADNISLEKFGKLVILK